MRKTTPFSTALALIPAAAVAIGILAGIAWAAPQETSERGFAWKDGAEVYAKVCAFCHEAQVGPTIRGRGFPPAYIRLIVRNGRGAMPAFRAAEIDDESLDKVAEYVSKKEADR